MIARGYKFFWGWQKCSEIDFCDDCTTMWKYCCLVAKLCPTFSNPMDCSLPGSSVHGISQTRILERVANSYFRVSSPSRDQTCISCIGRWILYHSAIWEAPGSVRKMQIKTMRRYHYTPIKTTKILKCM